jgi:hypothetical protein
VGKKRFPIIFMFRPLIGALLTAASLAVSSRALLADGFFVSDHYAQDVYAPDQKAVIAWDGAKETIVLSTKLQARELATGE